MSKDARQYRYLLFAKALANKMFDYSDSTFSPPADDSFFYIRYPKHQETSCTIPGINKEGFRPLNEILGNKDTNTSVAKTTTAAVQESSGNGKKSSIDFSKHPLSCQSFIPFGTASVSANSNVTAAASGKVNEPKVIVANKPKVKYPEANDEFNATTSECGRSIVHVAQQIMSSKFGKSNSSESSSSSSNQQVDDSNYQLHRRGSKSLPVTPIASPSGTPDSSPKSRRRAYGNRFFTGAFVPDPERKNGWLLSSILGQSREIVTPKIVEEDEQQVEPQLPARAMSRKKSISSQNLTYVGKEEVAHKSESKPQILQVKPSELREMNFWSPTSM